jgi:cysteinyl-tRNA synthetase
MLKLLNSYSKKLEPFKAAKGKTVTMYNCGPTVYDYAHIGNLRAFLFADVLRRYLEYQGYKVKQVMNITDVGHALGDVDVGRDKIEETVVREQLTPEQVVSKYSEAFFKDIDALNVERASVYPRATEHVGEMIKLISILLRKKIAYRVGEDVYFDLSKFLKYGKLSGNTVNALVAGHRVEVNPKKKHPYDFALWIHNPRHLMQWDSPWGKGYPGWHIECSAMSMKYLGATIDIHTGGEDNKFPHHEAEIAQSEAATGKPFVRYWLHAAHLMVNGEKMSKSLGNYFRLDDLVNKGYAPREVRYALIASHYRDAQNVTFTALDAAASAIGKLDSLWGRLNSKSAIRNPQSKTKSIKQVLTSAKLNFGTAMDNDLNTPAALAAVFRFVHEMNASLDRGVSDLERVAAKKLLKELMIDTFGIPLTEVAEEKAPHAVEKLLEDREIARAEKDFDRADELRDEIKKRGFEILDTSSGPKLKKVS